jgi:uncharacterized protein YcfL
MRKIIFAILSLFILTGCATKTKIEYVDREVVKYETKVQHDTLINNVHDSIYHTIFQKGDTIYDTKYVEKTKYRDRIVYQNDTCWRDSVATEYKETVKEVVKIPKIYRVALLISILSIIFAILKLTKWLKIR